MVIAIWSAIGAFVLALLGEALHARRTRRLGPLAFGPRSRPRPWTQAVLLLRPLAAAAVVLGLLLLWLEVEPRVLKSNDEEVKPGEERHLVLCLDVSPSMRLEDAGPAGDQSRLHRARDVLDSLFGRIGVRRYRISVVATFNGARPVVIDSKDHDVVRNILNDLPMHIGFRPGPTKLLSGLREAADIAEDWRPGSTILVMVSDGDTVPPTGMPEMPPSIEGVLICGVGDPVTGSFIDGHQSRQDTSALRQIARRLQGEYHDCNNTHIPTHMLGSLGGSGEPPASERFGLREYALLAIGLGSLLLALLPLLLQLAGGAWRVGHIPHPIGAAPDGGVGGRRQPGSSPAGGSGSARSHRSPAATAVPRGGANP